MSFFAEVAGSSPAVAPAFDPNLGGPKGPPFLHSKPIAVRLTRGVHQGTLVYTMASERRKRGGFRLDLGEPIASDLIDFCAANYGGSQTEVIREALADHINGRLGREPVLKARFEAARRQRLTRAKP